MNYYPFENIYLSLKDSCYLSSGITIKSKNFTKPWWVVFAIPRAYSCANSIYLVNALCIITHVMLMFFCTMITQILKCTLFASLKHFAI